MDPFKVEEIRALLAEKANLDELRLMYRRSLPQIEDKNTSKFWDDLNLNCSDYKFNNNPMASDRLRIVVNLLKGSVANILNVGFGSASLEKQYFNSISINKSILWTAIDISKKSVALAKARFPFVKFRVDSILNLKLENNKFDYVISLEVLEHIQPADVLKAIGELYRVLKKNGKLIVSVPLNEGLQSLILEGKNPNGHVRIYTPKLIKAELKMAGFQIINEYYMYAFRSHYKIKKIIIKCLWKKFRKPNGIIIISQKP